MLPITNIRHQLVIVPPPLCPLRSFMLLVLEVHLSLARELEGDSAPILPLSNPLLSPLNTDFSRYLPSMSVCRLFAWKSATKTHLLSLSPPYHQSPSFVIHSCRRLLVVALAISKLLMMKPYISPLFLVVEPSHLLSFLSSLIYILILSWF